MKTDSLFYQIFQTLPSTFFELIGQSKDEASGYEFKSVEIKETVKRIDGVFVPARRSLKPIYFVEVQFKFDEDFYYRFITESFLYIGQNKLNRDWFAVAIYARRSIEPSIPRPYNWLIGSPHIRRVYLDELGEAANQSVEIELIQLIVENEATAAQKARQLIQKVQQLEDEAIRRKVLELIETLLIYKLPRMSRQEIEAMFGLSELKQTRVYQEAKIEGKIETVPLLLRLGLSVEQIAQELNLDIELVRQVVQQQSDRGYGA